MSDLMQKIQARDAVRQFVGIGDLVLCEGLTPGPAGRECPECQRRGQVWIGERGWQERHVCLQCGWEKWYAVG
ncbi:MAG TPA: hypothetical protein EYH05_01685 [Anaerolineae bacterium]|nr:hypothetical protein [Anaerolineae bacterium]